MSIRMDAVVQAAVPGLVALRRDLHAHPELSWQEARTARVVAERLRAAGLEVHEGVARTGVVALLRGAQPGKTLLVRADMDALPIVEENDVPCRSQHLGVMHACGHDGHTAVAVTVAEVLARERDSLRGSVRFVFQPAEELASGARPMVEAGVLDGPPVDACLALHLWALLPVGAVGVHPGPMWASADELSIVVKGRGTHGALPHLGVDAIAVAAQVVTAVQTIVSREVSPLDAAVLSIGTIQGGSAFNIIADRVAMTGTLRSFDPSLRDRLLERVEGVVRGVTSALRAEYEFTWRLGTPAVVNDARMCDLVRNAASQVVGEANVVDPGRTTVSDDMAYFLERAPGCYFLVGVANPQKGTDRPHHSSRFKIDEDALPIAASVLLRAARGFLAS